MKHISLTGKGRACPAKSIEHPFGIHLRIKELFEGLFNVFGKIRIPSVKHLWGETGLTSTNRDIPNTCNAHKETKKHERKEKRGK